MTFSTHYRITADGGSRNNHDKTIPSEGYGSYLLETAKNQRIERLDFGNIPSNEAEFSIIVRAVEDLQSKVLYAGRKLDEFSLTIRMDSRMVIGSQGGWKNMKPFKIQAPHLRPLSIKLKQLLSAFSNVVWEKLPRLDIVDVLGH